MEVAHLEHLHTQLITALHFEPIRGPSSLLLPAVRDSLLRAAEIFQLSPKPTLADPAETLEFVQTLKSAGMIVFAPLF